MRKMKIEKETTLAFAIALTLGFCVTTDTWASDATTFLVQVATATADSDSPDSDPDPSDDGGPGDGSGGT